MDGLERARELYGGVGADVDAALKTLGGVSISMHCWQGDDVTGFENRAGIAGGSGGIAVTGAYPGKARSPEELMADMDEAFRLIPGRHRVNLHAIYTLEPGVPRDRPEPAHFKGWVDYARERGLGLDFNPTLFAHEKAADGLTLSHPDAETRRFWIEHCRATRRIAAYFGEQLNTPSLHNIWLPDGYKNTPADRFSPRMRLKESLDAIFADKYGAAFILDSVESKLFGIGVESYTVGSHEFYMNYALKNNLLCLLDNGHFHPTESVADKVSAMLLFGEKLALHVTRGVRWDSDHVVTLSDELIELAQAVVSCGALERVLFGLDYFDGSINRVAAWVIGMRNMQKALLYALLTPHKCLREMQNAGDFTGILALTEELKTYPFGAVWDAFCERHNVPPRGEWLPAVTAYDRRTRERVN